MTMFFQWQDDDLVLDVRLQPRAASDGFAETLGRLQLGISGLMPVTKGLPDQWFDTPNIHLCTLRDFEALCKEKNIDIPERTVVDHTHSNSTLLMRLLPNLYGEIVIYRFCRNGVQINS